MPVVTEYHRRIVKTTGDGMLVEIASVVDALKCAVAIQRPMDERETDMLADQRIGYRIDVNEGDVVIDGDDTFGDGVNVASRSTTLLPTDAVAPRQESRFCLCQRLSRSRISLSPWWRDFANVDSKKSVGRSGRLDRSERCGRSG